MKRYLSRYVLGVWLVVGPLSAPLEAAQWPDFTKLVEKYGPAVVNISTTAKKEERKDGLSMKRMNLKSLVPQLHSVPALSLEAMAISSPITMSLMRLKKSSCV